MIPGRMETLQEALARVERRGFKRSFRAVAEGRLELEGDSRFDPESLVIDETVRFEGASDPEDQAVLFALRTGDGVVKGTFVASYGPGMDRDCAAAIQRLERDRVS